MRGVNITEGSIRHSSDIDRFFCGNIDSLEKYFLNKDDVVIGMDGSKVGKNSAIVDAFNSASILVQRVARLRSVKETSLPFIYQHINSNCFHDYVDKVKTSSGIPHISAQQIKDFKIYFPKLNEQQKIASFLTAVDDKIQQLTKKKALLEQYKKGVMQQIFNQQIRFKDDDGNDYPDWEEKRLGEIGDFKNGLNKSKEDFGFGFPFINLMDVFGKTSIVKGNYDLVNASETELKTYNLKRGDVLFIRSSVKREGVGEASVILEDMDKTVYSGFLIRLREKDENKQMDLNFKKYCFSTQKFRNNLLAFSTTSANTNINQESLNLIGVNLPSLEEQQKIASFLTSIDDKINAVGWQLEQTQVYKKGLLQQMFV